MGGLRAKGRRGGVVPVPHGKTRITIRIDTDVLDWFREQVNAAGGGNYQTSMNDVLRRHVEGREELQCPRRPGGTSLAEETPASRGRRGRDLRCAEAGVRARPSGTARSRGV